uniref:Uncharacterized protein n=1 Tax=Arundo donax TaxID=35708 RepID=A0A0A9DPP0_ARUDO
MHQLCHFDYPMRLNTIFICLPLSKQR